MTEHQLLSSLAGEGGGVSLSILHKYFGFTSFRGIQQDIIESIRAGHDTLGLMPAAARASLFRCRHWRWRASVWLSAPS